MSPPTFSLQSTLSRLPVPSLEESCALYLKSLIPLQSAEEHAETTKKVHAFMTSELGRSLQQRLIDIDRASPNNWLEDNFWLKKAYLEWREPLMVNSNWYILGQHDAHHPPALLASPPPAGTFSHFQIHRAAHMISRAIEFKEKIDRQTLPIDMMRGNKPQCMWQYSRIFGVTRVPLHGCDTLVQAQTGYITVIVRDQVYKVDVYTNGVPRSTPEIEKSLMAVIADVEKLSASGALSVPVPLLTSWHRDSWTMARNHLLSISPVHRDHLHIIEGSIITLSLDDYAHGCDSTQWTKTMFCGHQKLGNGHNRWFDKSLSLVVENNGACGVVGEHSPVDALTASYIFDYMLIEPCPQAMDTVIKAATPGPVEHLAFSSDRHLDQCLKQAQTDADATAALSDSEVLIFKDYGTDWIKKVGRLPPDAFCQMVLQLTYYRLHQKITPTYETASTRQYLCGRTETIRTCSADTKALVEAFDTPLSSQEKYALLKKATSSHREYTQIASQGHGCDRHLMVLRLLNQTHTYLKNGEPVQAEMHPMFTDPIHIESQTWKLSTSGLHAGIRLMGTGFGAVYQDGYGVNYMAAPQLIKFGMESKRVKETAPTAVFKATVEKTLRDLYVLCEEVNRSAKL